MNKIGAVVLGSLFIAACGGESPNADQQQAVAAAATAMSEIVNPPDPCSMLTAGTAQAELGVSAVTALPANSESGQGAPPWTCAFESGESSISLVVSRSSINSSEGATAVADAYAAATGFDYSTSSIGLGTVNLVHQGGATSKVVAWSGLNWSGDGELFVEATVSTESKTPEQRAEIANALVELCVSTARQVAAMGG